MRTLAGLVGRNLKDTLENVYGAVVEPQDGSGIHSVHNVFLRYPIVNYEPKLLIC